MFELVRLKDGLLFTLLRGGDIGIIAIFIHIIITVIINSSKKINFGARWRTLALAKIILLLVTVAMNDHCHPHPQYWKQYIHPSLPREGQVDCVKLLASRGAGLDAKTEVATIEDKSSMCDMHGEKSPI